MRASQPQLVFRAPRIQRERFFEKLRSLAVIAQHEVILAHQRVAGGVGRSIDAQNPERSLIVRMLIKSLRLPGHCAPSPRRQNQETKNGQDPHIYWRRLVQERLRTFSLYRSRVRKPSRDRQEALPRTQRERRVAYR